MWVRELDLSVVMSVFLSAMAQHIESYYRRT